MKHTVVQWDRRDTYLRVGQSSIASSGGQGRPLGGTLHYTDVAGVVHTIGNSLSSVTSFVPNWFIDSAGTAQGVI